ncbi:MAG: TlpA disulfide reductase family protein [Bryobacteraceae bacterium]
MKSGRGPLRTADERRLSRRVTQPSVGLGVLLFAGLVAAQQRPPVSEEQEKAQQQELQAALADAGSSQLDFARAIERHLEKYPLSAQRAELERAAARAAVEARDPDLIVRFGERVLAREPQNIELLERVSRYLLNSSEAPESKRALDYASRLENLADGMGGPAEGSRSAARFAEEKAILVGKSRVYQARGQGNLGKFAEAEAMARKSYAAFPSAESAREIARWMERQEKTGEAVAYLADAFMIPDPNATPEDRRKDRTRLAEWTKKAGRDDAWLGRELLAAYDRTAAQVDEYRERIQKLDPNAAANAVKEFTLTGIGGDRLAMASLAGKVVVLDFWATWCGPCRAQQPLYEQVQARFKTRDDVVFLNVNTDENRAIVKPFLDREKWNKNVYFEDGLAGFLRVSSIPTTVILNRKGDVASRMNGYVPDRFVEVLGDRVEQLLGEK